MSVQRLKADAFTPRAMSYSKDGYYVLYTDYLSLEQSHKEVVEKGRRMAEELLYVVPGNHNFLSGDLGGYVCYRCGKLSANPHTIPHAEDCIYTLVSQFLTSHPAGQEQKP